MTAGKKFESDVAAFLRSQGLPAFPPTQAGFNDRGDLHLDPFVMQCKDYPYLVDAVRDAVNGAHDQASVTGLIPVGVVRRRRRPIADTYVVMTLETFADIAAMIRKDVPS